jgi:hypothetical protein
MAFKVKAPAGESYFLDQTDKYYSIDPADRTFVVIREATQSEDSVHSTLFAEITRVIDSTSKNPKQVQIKQSLSSDELKEMDIYLTLADTNITDENGQALIRFKKVGSISKVDMSEGEFKNALGKLPGRVVSEIHEKVALKNPDWFGEPGEGSSRRP